MDAEESIYDNQERDRCSVPCEHAPRKRGPVPQVQRQLERISQLPKPKQRAVMDVIEALLAQQGR